MGYGTADLLLQEVIQICHASLKEDGLVNPLSTCTTLPHTADLLISIRFPLEGYQDL